MRGKVARKIRKSLESAEKLGFDLRSRKYKERPTLKLVNPITNEVTIRTMIINTGKAMYRRLKKDLLLGRK